MGFIQKLPHNVVAAFRATLEEVVEADLLVHVIDISHPFALEQAISVENTLRHDLGIEQLSMVPVFNKADRLDNTEPKGLNALIDHYPEGVLVSAVTGEGLPDLLTAIEAELMSSMVRVQVAIPYTQADMISLFYDLAHVEDEQADADSMHLTGLMRPRHAAIYDRFRQE
ncbi:MAG: hypothetical protein GYB64_04855 [Chloroflexi bacterium]|nr:hypothetical protein [Chloroflexota bacterium]